MEAPVRPARRPTRHMRDGLIVSFGIALEWSTSKPMLSVFGQLVVSHHDADGLGNS